MIANALDRMAGGPDDNDASGNRLVAHALTKPSNGAAWKGDGTDDFAVTSVGVRRLTPRECERLQGLPDDWTLIRWKGKPAADSLRYAALGDAVTANVGEWIGARIIAAERTEALKEAA